MSFEDPAQEILKAVVNYLNITWNGGTVPVTTTFHQNDHYVLVSIPSIPGDDGTNDNPIFDLTLRAEVVTEFLTDEERETVSNKIMQQVSRQLSDEASFNAYLSNFEVPLINYGSTDRETQQENTSSIIIKRKDFNLKVVQL